jgi:hypothetical protein
MPEYSADTYGNAGMTLEARFGGWQGEPFTAARLTCLCLR